MLVKMLSLRHGAIVFAITFIIIIILLSSSSQIQPSSYTPKIAAHKYSDAETSEQAHVCSDHHGVLYKDIESTEAYWNRVGGMTRDDLELSRFICERDGNCANMKLYNGQLYIRAPIAHALGYQSRQHSMLLMLNRLDLTFAPNVDFLINSNDGVRVFEPCFLEMDKHISEAESKSRDEAINHFLMPDFTAYDWWEAKLPAFNEARLSLAEESGPFEFKTPKLFWRGATVLQQGTQRTDLVSQLGPQTDVADVADTTVKHLPEGDDKSNLKYLKTLKEMCQYQYIVYTEGITYSGRLKYTALCNSIQIGHKITFVEFWTHLLDPYYVTVKDWDDALRKYKKLRNNPEKAAALANGAKEALRKHLSPSGINCYMRRMLEGYARSMRWQVLSPEQDVTGRNGTEVVPGFSWIPLEHFLAKMTWLGTNGASANHSTPLVW